MPLRHNICIYGNYFKDSFELSVNLQNYLPSTRYADKTLPKRAP